MPVTISKVTSRSQMRDFVNFPEMLYKDNPYWVPELVGDMYDTFNPRKNAAFEYCEAQCFLAYKDGRLSGRVAAIINHNANKVWGDIVRFGWIDFIEDEEVVEALVGAVQDWGRERGCDTLKGTWGFTDMDREGTLVEGFDKLSSFTCIYNYPYYDVLLKKAGLQPEAEWSQRLVHIPTQIPERIARLADAVENKYNLHEYEAKSMSEIIGKYGMELFHLYNKSFSKLEEFSPLTDKQIEQYIASYKSVLNTDFVALVVNGWGELAGFGICVPTISMAIKKSRGRLLPFGLFRILRALKHNDTIEAMLIGVHPEYEGRGVSLLIFRHMLKGCAKMGITRMIMNPQLLSNHKVQNLFDGYDVEPYTLRRAYVKHF